MMLTGIIMCAVVTVGGIVTLLLSLIQDKKDHVNGW